ncbi:uncharacterized protein UDID_19026 [Ustilago sp. UG-2017a]|nr:uncharacterized protein UDID_19026 [Ustilago sp. UG-2017a]
MPGYNYTWAIDGYRLALGASGIKSYITRTEKRGEVYDRNMEWCGDGFGQLHVQQESRAGQGLDHYNVESFDDMGVNDDYQQEELAARRLAATTSSSSSVASALLAASATTTSTAAVSASSTSSAAATSTTSSSNSACSATTSSASTSSTTTSSTIIISTSTSAQTLVSRLALSSAD